MPLHEMCRGVLITDLFMGQSICYPTDNETNLGGIADEASDWFLCARIRAGGGARSGSTGGNGGRSVRRARVFPERGQAYSYYNDRFDLHDGDLVYVSGKLAANADRWSQWTTIFASGWQTTSV